MVSSVRTCPACGSPHDNYPALAMHMVKMQDEAHSSIGKMDEALEQLSHEGVLIGRDHGVECPNRLTRGEPVHA